MFARDALLVGQRHFILSSITKRKRGNELRTIPRSRFGLQKRSVTAKTGAVQLGKFFVGRLDVFQARRADNASAAGGATGRRVVRAAALKRDAGVTLLADRRLAKPAIVCSHRSGERFSRSRIGGAFAAIDPRFSGFI